MYLKQGKEIKHSEVNKIVYKTDNYASVLENVKYRHMLSIRRISIVFIVGPILHLYSIYLKNTFWMHAFCIFYSLIFILQIIILLCSD